MDYTDNNIFHNKRNYFGDYPMDHKGSFWNNVWFWEILGSVLWLLMDGFWMMEIKLAATVLIFPTVAVTTVGFWFCPKTVSGGAVTAAIVSWVAMNSFWMIGDLYTLSIFLFAAKVFFSLCLICIITALINELARGECFVSLRRFRRFRLRIQKD